MADNNIVCSVEIIDREKVDRVNAALPKMKETSETANLFKALADPTRLRIVQALLLEELCVCDISAVVDVSVSAISHQLRLLRNMKIVKNRKEGKMVYYSLDDDHVRGIIETAQIHLDET